MARRKPKSILKSLMGIEVVSVLMLIAIIVAMVLAAKQQDAVFSLSQSVAKFQECVAPSHAGDLEDTEGSAVD